MVDFVGPLAMDSGGAWESGRGVLRFHPDSGKNYPRLIWLEGKMNLL